MLAQMLLVATDTNIGAADGSQVHMFQWQKASQANHNPVAAFGSNSADSIIRLKAKPGDVLSLGASASTDPDGDSLNFKWFAYPEAGTYSRTVNIATSSSAKASMTVPQDAQVRQIHIILQVWDNSKIVSMYDYRRVVIDVGD